MKSLPASILLLAMVCGTAQALTEGYYEHDEQARALLSSVDWDKAKVVEITLDDFTFKPHEIILERNRPAILRLSNVGKLAHDMSGRGFFQVALIRQVSSDTFRVVTPYIQSIHVRPRQQAEIWLLPVRSGTFSFQCGIPGHREQGMEGQVTVR